MADADLPPLPTGASFTPPSQADDLPPLPAGASFNAPAASKESWSDWGRRIYGGVENALHREAVATDPWPVMHDMGAGAIRQFAGLGELDPSAHPYAVDLEKQIKDPKNAAGMVGGMVPFLMGGGAGEVASLVPSASKAPGILNTAGRIASATGKGAVGGGVVGAETGITAPTGEDDYAESLRKKTKLAGAEGLIGASIGAGVGGAVGIAPEAYGLYQTAAKKPANAAAEDFRKWASGEGVSAASAEEAKALEAGKTATETQADIAKREADLAKTHAERGAMTEQAIDASETTKKLIEGFKAGAKTSDVELGGQVQKIVDETVEKLEGEREKAAGFAKALADAGDEPRVPTQSALDYIRTWKARESDTIRAVLDKFERQLTTKKPPAGQSLKTPEPPEPLASGPQAPLAPQGTMQGPIKPGRNILPKTHADVEGYVNDLAQRFGVSNRIKVKTSNLVAGPHGLLGRDGTLGERADIRALQDTGASVDRLAPYNGDFTIKINSALEPEHALHVAAHEFGHALQYTKLLEASPETKAGIVDAYKAFLTRTKGLGADEASAKELDSLVNALNGFGEGGVRVDPDYFRYKSKFGEWFADNVRTFLTTNREATTIADKFFKGAADAWRFLYQRVTGRTGTAKEVEDFLLQQGKFSPTETTVADASAAAGEAEDTQAISVYRANALRKEINAAMRTKRLRLENSDLAVDAATLHHLNEIQKLLNGEAKQAWPPYAQALEKHAEMSRPLDPYYHEGPLKGLATTGEFSGNYKMLPGQVVAQIMQKSAKGAEAFKELMARDPSVKDSVRQYLRWKLVGESGTRDVTPKTLRTFLDNNQEVLEQTGLLDEFKHLSNAISGSEAAASSAQSAVERLATEAKVKAGNLDAVKSTLKEAEKAGTLAAENRAKYEKLLDNLSAAKPEKVVGEARALVDKLTDDGHIPREARQKALEQINEIEQKYQDAASARKALMALSGFLIINAAGYEGYLFSRGVTHMASGGHH